MSNERQNGTEGMESAEQNQSASAGEDGGIRAQSSPTYFTCISAIPPKLLDVAHAEKRGGGICQGFARVKQQKNKKESGRLVTFGRKARAREDFLSVCSTSRGTVEGRAP